MSAGNGQAGKSELFLGGKMKKFDTKVQEIKYEVLKTVAKYAWDDMLMQKLPDIPVEIAPGDTPTMRCCVYKERAILLERIKIAMGGDRRNGNVIEVIDIACDECPMGGYEITNSCRGCIAHHCKAACPKDAIRLDNNYVAHIDKSLCVNCGACAKVCPYSAIINRKTPCESACKVKAISKNENKVASINNDKCIACGACVYQCPFGAITDKSFILDVIDILKRSDKNNSYKVYAMVAPSISSQFSYAKLGQVISGLKKLGFHTVVEAALGADMVAYEEAQELVEKGFLTSSCCPAFVNYIHKNFPDIVPMVSSNLSPMGALAKYIKKIDPAAKVVFIGPCTAKKMEVELDAVREYVDVAMTFEELQALLDSRDIDITALGEDVLDNASYYGRIFARVGGLSDAVAQSLREQGFDSFEVNSAVCDGIEECKIALMKKSKGILDANFIEGMACIDGCIGGAGCLTHGKKNRMEVDKYGKEAYEKNISDAISVLR